VSVFKSFKADDRMSIFLLVAYLDVAILSGVALIAHSVESTTPAQKNTAESCFVSDAEQYPSGGNCESDTADFAKSAGPAFQAVTRGASD
jgi:hypothetical protein